MSGGHRLGELAQHVGGCVRGDAQREIHGLATLEEATEHDLSFLTNPRYRAAAERTRAAALLVAPGAGPAGRDLLEVAQPYVALARLLELFHPPVPLAPGVSPDARIAASAQVGRDAAVAAFAVVAEQARIGERTVLEAGCYVGARCRVGDDCWLGPNAVLYPGTQVGARCRIHAGVVLGADGFGFATDAAGEHRKIPQVGCVVLEDDVEVGANSTIDRAMLGATRVGRGSKIDDLVMIAHGVRLGRRALLAAQSGIAGSARLGEDATLAGQAGVAGHLQLGHGVVVGAKSAVFADVADGAFVAGVPAVDHRRWKRSQALIKQLPELRSQLRDVRARLAAIERQLAGDD